MFNVVFDILFWPSSIFLRAFFGTLCPPEDARQASRRRTALTCLIGSIGAFGIAVLLRIFVPRLSAVTEVLALIGVPLFVVFVIVGNLCASQLEKTEKGDEP